MVCSVNRHTTHSALQSLHINQISNILENTLLFPSFDSIPTMLAITANLQLVKEQTQEQKYE